MKQEILYHEYPPIFDEIVKVFPFAADKGVIFSWGDKVYFPQPTGLIPPQLVAHEEVHGGRQLNYAWEIGQREEEPKDNSIEFYLAENERSVRMWWEEYLKNPQFRLTEELPAHQVEYKVYCEMVKDKNQRARYLHRMAMRLAGPLYGSLITYTEAKKQIQQK